MSYLTQIKSQQAEIQNLRQQLQNLTQTSLLSSIDAKISAQITPQLNFYNQQITPLQRENALLKQTITDLSAKLAHFQANQPQIQTFTAEQNFDDLILENEVLREKLSVKSDENIVNELFIELQQERSLRVRAENALRATQKQNIFLDNALIGFGINQQNE